MSLADVCAIFLSPLWHLVCHLNVYLKGRFSQNYIEHIDLTFTSYFGDYIYASSKCILHTF